MENCKNNTTRQREGFGVCRSAEEIDNYVVNSSNFIELIDFYAEVLNYKVPLLNIFIL